MIDNSHSHQPNRSSDVRICVNNSSLDYTEFFSGRRYNVHADLPNRTWGNRWNNTIQRLYDGWMRGAHPPCNGAGDC
jgi:hypothetical protein